MRKSFTKKELSEKYGVHYNTFLKWLKEIKTLDISPKNRLLTPKQVEIIYRELGEP